MRKRSAVDIPTYSAVLVDQVLLSFERILQASGKMSVLVSKKQRTHIK